MFQIQDTLVSLDLVERHFCCDLATCHGACCIEGDAGAPLTEAERGQLEEILPLLWDDLLPRAQEAITDGGVAYRDPEGELVTQLVDGTNCVFTCYEPGGLCSCAIERAYRAGRIAMRKPISCYLYPVRVKQFDGYAAVNYHRWKICKCAEVLGRQLYWIIVAACALLTVLVVRAFRRIPTEQPESSLDPVKPLFEE